MSQVIISDVKKKKQFVCSIGHFGAKTKKLPNIEKNKRIIILFSPVSFKILVNLLMINVIGCHF
jgi:hypothetical protein